MTQKVNDTDDLLDLLNSKDAEDYKFKVALRKASGIYKLGPPQRPDFKHDNGHLDKFPKRAPTDADKEMLKKWRLWLKGSEFACEERTFLGMDFSLAKHVDKCGTDLPQANMWYRNFLYGQGKSMTVDYEKYIRQEDNGRTGVNKIARDFMEPAEVLGHNRVAFSMTSVEMIPIGGKSKIRGPQTPNWAKTFGAHQIWINAEVKVSVKDGQIHFDANLTYNMEDMYNFNPGQKDEKTNIKDEENGMLELSGLGHQFMTYAKFHRRLQWIKGDYESAIITGPNGPIKLNYKYY